MAISRRSWMLIAGLLLSGAVMALLHVEHRDERLIRRQLREIIARCEKRPGTGALRSLSSAGELRAYFMPEATVKLGRPYPAHLNAREVPPLVARAHAEVDRLEISIIGLELLPRTAPDQIETRLAAELRITRGDVTERHEDEYRLRWQKMGGNWKIAEARSDSSIQPIW